MQKYKVYINNEAKFFTENWESFCSNYMLIIACGGVVYNTDKQLLMIYRNDKWDLPKGKLEANETLRECALREVEEECSVNNLSILNELESTYHVYKINGKKVLKKTHWFRMKTEYSDKLIPQHEEGITKVEWINKHEIKSKLNNTYPNLIDILLNETV